MRGAPGVATVGCYHRTGGGSALDQEGGRSAALPAWMPHDQPGVGVVKVTLGQGDGLPAIPVVCT